MAERSAEPLPACFAGLGAGSPRPRQKRGGMFCSVEDAFDNKTLDFPSLGGGGGGRSRGSATPSDGSSSPAPPPPRSPGAATAGGMSDGCRQVRAWGWLGAPPRSVPCRRGSPARGPGTGSACPRSGATTRAGSDRAPCCGREAASDGSSERMAPAGGGGAGGGGRAGAGPRTAGHGADTRSGGRCRTRARGAAPAAR